MAISDFIDTKKLGSKYVAPTRYSPVIPEDKRPGGSIKTGIVKVRRGGNGRNDSETQKVYRFDDSTIKALKQAGANNQQIQELRTKFSQQEVLDRLSGEGPQSVEQQFQQMRESRLLREEQQKINLIQQQGQELENQIKQFEEKYSGRRLPSGTFARAEKERLELEKKIRDYQFAVEKQNVASKQLREQFGTERLDIKKQVAGQQPIRQLIKDTTPVEQLVSKTSKIPEIPITKIEGPKSLIKDQDIITKKNLSKQIERTEKELITKKLPSENLTPGDFKALEGTQKRSRQVLRQQAEGLADIVLLTTPLSLVGKIPLVARAASSVGKLGTAIKTSKTAQVIGQTKIAKKISDFIKPTITFKRTSPIEEIRIFGEGQKALAKGKGILRFETKGPIAKILKRPAKQVSVPIDFKLNIKNVFEQTGLKASRKTPLGSPRTLTDIVPEDRIAELIRTQKLTGGQAKGQAGFTIEGFVKTGKKDVRLVKESFNVAPKQVRVRTAPSGAVKEQFEKTLKTIKLKLQGFGDETVFGAKTKAVSKNDVTLLIRQKVRVQGGPRFDIKTIATRGRVKSVFDVGKVSVKPTKDFGLSKSGDTLLKQIVKTSGKQAQVTQTKASVVPALQKASKQYLDVYGFQNYLKTAKTAARTVSQGFAGASLVSSKQVPRQTNLDKTIIGIKQNVLPKFDTNVLASTKTLDALDVKVSDSLIEKQIVNTKTSIAQDTGLLERTSVAEKQLVKQSTQLKQPTLQKVSLARPVNVVPRVPIPIPPVVLPKLKFGKVGFKASPTKIRKDAFNVFVKRKKKFVPIGKQLPLNKARRLGANEVDNTTSRSFKLVKSGTTTKKDIGSSINLTKFRRPFKKSLLPSGTYVEKSLYAIDSVGEKKGIPGKARIINLTKPRKSRKKRKALRQKRRK